ncbi:MAG TPA: phage/plasmid primase, P4 family [Candidatus Acidoferrales bacterium]|jgi:putative DNA primase/helicase|nr:phage/plasmid primase, P4 family [Candidatus Acidoferrales bacterium]
MSVNTTRQQPSSTDYQFVPSDLKTLRQWVCWRREVRDGKPTKVPYTVDGSLASTNRPGTWTTFDEVSAATGFDGIGFVLTGTQFVGLDFDGVLNDAGEAEPYVLEILRLLGNPYTEVTPSGRGLRTFVEPVTPLPGSKRKLTKGGYGAEIYSGAEAGRYLTTTGRQYSGEGIPKIENVSLPYFLICQIQDPKFKRLWLGDTSEYDGDDSRADLALMGMLARLLDKNFQRMEAAFNASFLGRREKWQRDDYRRRTIAKALEGIILGAPASTPLDPTSSSLGDTGNAELVLTTLNGRALYCRELKQWFLADQVARWAADRTNRISQLVQQAMAKRWQELARTPDPKDPMLRHALRSLDRHALTDCVSILEFQQSISVLPEALDSDPLLLGVENGILSLYQGVGELLEPRLDLLVTKCAPVRFDPDTKCDAFLDYLERVQPNPETQKFLQRLAGSFLTGLQPEQSFIFFLGSGANGKSVFVRVMHDLLGTDYCWKARKQLLFNPDKRSGEQAAGANDIADLEGRRLICATEQIGKRWNLSFIKDYSGGEQLHGRQLYLQGRNFKATGKILVSANIEPSLDEFDEAVRRRFVLVPWHVTIPPKDRHVPLESYVQSLLKDGGASGILNWALAGLQDLVSRNFNLDPPQDAEQATSDYLRDEDEVARFFNDWTENVIGQSMTTKELRKAYVVWRDEKYAMSAHSFTKECRRIFGKERCHVGRARSHVVDGLRLSDYGQAEYNRAAPEQKGRCR